jgi:hypothetical protein
MTAWQTHAAQAEAARKCWERSAVVVGFLAATFLGWSVRDGPCDLEMMERLDLRRASPPPMEQTGQEKERLRGTAAMRGAIAAVMAAVRLTGCLAMRSSARCLAEMSS